MLNVRKNGSGAVLREFSVENLNGCVVGTYRRFKTWKEMNDSPVPLQPASFSKVEAQHLVADIKENLFFADEITPELINSALEEIQRGL